MFVNVMKKSREFNMLMSRSKESAINDVVDQPIEEADKHREDEACPEATFRPIN